MTTGLNVCLSDDELWRKLYLSLMKSKLRGTTFCHQKKVPRMMESQQAGGKILV